MTKNSYILFLVFIMAYGVTAQRTTDSPIIVKADANACEINSAHIDYIRTEIANTKERIFVVARAGQNESDTVNLRRLQKLRQFLEKVKGFASLDVVYSRGDDVKGEGQIDIYSGSTLRLTIKAKFNRAPCMDCCDGDYLSSPSLLLKTRAKKKAANRNK